MAQAKESVQGQSGQLNETLSQNKNKVLDTGQFQSTRLYVQDPAPIPMSYILSLT